jgi:hypothetical protein
MYPDSMPMHQGRQLPIFTLREIDLPEVKVWSVNGSYYLVMKVKMIGKRDQRVSEAPEDKEKIEGDFEVHSIQALGDKPVDAISLERKQFSKIKAKVLSGEYK